MRGTVAVRLSRDRRHFASPLRQPPPWARSSAWSAASGTQASASGTRSLRSSYVARTSV